MLPVVLGRAVVADVARTLGRVARTRSRVLPLSRKVSFLLVGLRPPVSRRLQRTNRFVPRASDRLRTPSAYSVLRLWCAVRRGLVRLLVILLARLLLHMHGSRSWHHHADSRLE